MNDEYQSPFFNDEDDISSSSPAESDDLFSNENQVDLNSFAELSDDSEQGKSKNPKKKKTPKTTKQKVLKGVLSVFLVFVITMCLVVGSFLIYVFGFIDDTVDVNLYDMDQAYTPTIYVKVS